MVGAAVNGTFAPAQTLVPKPEERLTVGKTVGVMVMKRLLLVAVVVETQAALLVITQYTRSLLRSVVVLYVFEAVF